MQYQDCGISVQAAAIAADDDAVSALRLADANINPSTRLASDYLNHFSEAIMLLEMVPGSPDFLDDFLGWQPASYRQHFLASRFKGRDLALAAYYTADPAVLKRLDALAAAMTAIIETTRTNMTAGLSPEATGALAARAGARLKLLVARAGAVINGEIDLDLPATPQETVDGLMRRSA